ENFARLCGGGRAGGGGASLRAGRRSEALSQPHRQNHRVGSARRRPRRRCARDRGSADENVGPTVRGREPAPRPPPSPRRGSRPGRARRLHLARGAAGAAHDQRRNVQEAQLRPAAFEPLAIMTSIPNTLAVRLDLPAASVAELIAYAKANPGKLNFGSQGVGSTPHLTRELFARVTGTELTHVPYRGTAQAVNDLIAGNVDMLFFQLDSVREQYRANKVKMLAVTTAARIASVPEVPTMEEAGVKEFRSDSWNALAAPPKTPAAIVAKLNDAINAVLKQRATAEHLRGMNMNPVGGTPDAAKIFIKQEAERWGGVIRAAKISLD